MPVQYCMHCGGGTSYTAIKPDKCGKCSRSFAVAVAPKVAATKPIYTPAPVQPVEPEPVSGADALAKFNLKPLSEEDVIIESTSTVRFNDIMRNPDSVSDKREGKRTRRSKKALVDEFFNEGK